MERAISLEGDETILHIHSTDKISPIIAKLPDFYQDWAVLLQC
jgi:hypothetical protein